MLGFKFGFDVGSFLDLDSLPGSQVGFQRLKGWAFVCKGSLKRPHLWGCWTPSLYLWGKCIWKCACIILRFGRWAKGAHLTILACVCLHVFVWDMFDVSSSVLAQSQSTHSGTDNLISSRCPAWISMFSTDSWQRRRSRTKNLCTAINTVECEREKEGEKEGKSEGMREGGWKRENRLWMGGGGLEKGIQQLPCCPWLS